MYTTCFGVRLQCRPDTGRFYVPPVAIKFVTSHIFCHIAAGFMPSSFVWISQLVLYCNLHCSCNRCILLWNCEVLENCLDWNVTNVMQIECYKSRRNKTLFHNFEHYRLVTIFTFWIISFKLCTFLCHVLWKALSKQIEQSSCKRHHVLPTVGIEKCLGWFPWKLQHNGFTETCRPFPICIIFAHSNGHWTYKRFSSIIDFKHAGEIVLLHTM